MAEAITISNENRRLLKEIEQLRIGDPPRITGEEALQIIGPSMWMTKKDHNQLLKVFLERSDTLQARSGARVYLQSSPLDDLHLTSLIESCGAVVVSEGHCWGIRNAEQPIDPSADPMEAIVDRYQFKPPCSRTFPMTRRRDLLIRQVTEADAQGVIFFIHDEDAQAWEVYEQGQALKAKGIPFLVLTQQPYRIADPAALKQEIGSFIGTL
jgi:benzoyl-CoA reductase/2-hydroxyglutaryl-CoA dehydratase subunit BcrC/BadD/HgdB